MTEADLKYHGIEYTSWGLCVFCGENLLLLTGGADNIDFEFNGSKFRAHNRCFTAYEVAKKLLNGVQQAHKKGT